MKRITAFFALFFIASISVFAQKPTPMVDYKGHILNGKNQIGSITSEGGFDQAGKSMTKVDGKGNIVDSNGKIIGTAPKNGTFVYYFDDNQEKEHRRPALVANARPCDAQLQG